MNTRRHTHTHTEYMCVWIYMYIKGGGNHTPCQGLDRAPVLLQWTEQQTLHLPRTGPPRLASIRLYQPG